MTFNLTSVRERNLWNVLNRSGNDPAGMLNDDHMSVLMNLIPTLNMQDTIFFQALFNIQPVNVNNHVVQILFSGHIKAGHWICVWFDGSCLRVYDSLGNELNIDHKRYLYLMFPHLLEFPVRYEKVQRQKMTYNCGLFAICFAVSIHFGVCPCNIIFDEIQMRNHVTKMFRRKVIEFFPILFNNNPAEILINENNEIIGNNYYNIHSYVGKDVIIDMIPAFYDCFNVFNNEINGNNKDKKKRRLKNNENHNVKINKNIDNVNINSENISNLKKKNRISRRQNKIYSALDMLFTNAKKYNLIIDPSLNNINSTNVIKEKIDLGSFSKKNNNKININNVSKSNTHDVFEDYINMKEIELQLSLLYNNSNLYTLENPYLEFSAENNWYIRSKQLSTKFINNKQKRKDYYKDYNERRRLNNMKKYVENNPIISKKKNQ